VALVFKPIAIAWVWFANAPLPIAIAFEAEATGPVPVFEPIAIAPETAEPPDGAYCASALP
jgi:hypothetical protein